MLLFSSNSRNERGQGLVEYAIILALVAIVVIGAMRILGPQISCAFSTINSSLPGEGNNSSSNCTGGSNGGDFGNYAAIGNVDKTRAIYQYCNEYGLPPGTGYNLYTKENDGITNYVVTGQADDYGTFQGTSACP